MMNTTLFEAMIDRYNELSFTHDYMFGFEYRGNVYFCETTAEVLPFILTLDKASRGQGYALRFKPTANQKLFLLTKNAHLLCSKEFFEATVQNSKYNKGEIFEKMVTEYFGQEWEKDNLPFTDGGDLTINGFSYQLKYEKATFTNEKILSRR